MIRPLTSRRGRGERGWRRGAPAPRYASLLVLLGLALTGCATHTLDTARYNYYAGRPDLAFQSLDREDLPKNDEVLYLMERGMILQRMGEYEKSSADFIRAYDRLIELEQYSVSKGGASLVINDNVQQFKGAPYERTLLHVFTTLNHYALGHWADAGVEARRMIQELTPEQLGNYPDDAFSRYITGLSLELADDQANAEIQYRKADELSEGFSIDPRTGHFIDDLPENQVAKPGATHELVLFLAMGRSYRGAGNWHQNAHLTKPGYAEVYANGEFLGRSYPFTDTIDLAYTTQQIQSARKTVKTVSRIAIKEALAQTAAHNFESDAAGDLVRLVLIGLLEKPDVRRWETLPRWLQVARVPCPPDLDSYEVVFKNGKGFQTKRIKVEQPLQKHRKTYVSFCNDVPTRIPVKNLPREPIP